jgi:hypothetical protein
MVVAVSLFLNIVMVLQVLVYRPEHEEYSTLLLSHFNFEDEKLKWFLGH